MSVQVKGKELKSAAKAIPAPSEATRKLCAARLMTLVEKAGKAHKHTEPDKPKQKAKQPLPGPPTTEQPGTGPPAGGITAGGGVAKEKTDVTKQHERRGENTLLKELVELLRTLHETKVSLRAFLDLHLIQPQSRLCMSRHVRRTSLQLAEPISCNTSFFH